MRKSYFQKPHKGNRILKEILSDFTFTIFENMLNISNLQRLENHINITIRVVEVFEVFGFYLGGWDRKGEWDLCAGFDCDRVNFLHRSWHGAMFWICTGNSVDNRGMF